jgi:hypothetical protein
VTELLENREATLAALRRLLCQASTEKTAQVLKQAGLEVSEKSPRSADQHSRETAAPGHGRHEAADYRGAHKIKVPHGSLQQQDPALEELIPQAAQGEVLYNDDTSMHVLALRLRAVSASEEFGDRTGVFTSSLVSTGEGRQIALFFTGRKHAGENLGEVLKQRATERDPPIQMCHLGPAARESS